MTIFALDNSPVLRNLVQPQATDKRRCFLLLLMQHRLSLNLAGKGNRENTHPGKSQGKEIMQTPLDCFQTQIVWT